MVALIVTIAGFLDSWGLYIGLLLLELWIARSDEWHSSLTSAGTVVLVWTTERHNSAS